MNANWTGLLTAAFAAITLCGISDGSSENDAMVNFKKSLSPEDQALLKSHMSKSGFIKTLLERSKGVDKRDQIVELSEEDKREFDENSELSCCSCNPGATGCFHPKDVKRSRIIRCCIPRSPADVQKREENEEILESLSPEDQQLMKKHMSKLSNLAEAQKKSVKTNDESDESVEKREQTVDEDAKDEATDEALQSLINKLDALRSAFNDMKKQKEEQTKESDSSAGGDITKRFLDDVNRAKKYGIKLDDLLAGLRRRAKNQKH
jgi:DNA-binding MarR family transcriptional regulator